jgi:hypothetical protein
MVSHFCSRSKLVTGIGIACRAAITFLLAFVATGTELSCARERYLIADTLLWTFAL